MVMKNPKKVFLSFKTACLTKAKAIQDFMIKHATVVLNNRKVLQLETLQKFLRDPFKRMELPWDNLKGENDNDTVFDEVEVIVNASKEAVSKALVDSEEFLEEKENAAQATGTGP